MHKHRKSIGWSISIIIIFSLTAFNTPVRGVVVNGTPGGFLAIESGTLVDSSTGEEYALILTAGEAEDSAGVGNVVLQLIGPAFAICSAHGAGVDIGPGLEDGNYAGNFPLAELQCGTAYGMPVSIDGCNAKLEMHGYSHTDYPLHPFMGPTTIEMSLRKSTYVKSQVNVKVYTPTGVIKLSGIVSDPVRMNTCE